MSDSIETRIAGNHDGEGIMQLIHRIQSVEFGVPIGLNDQKDLADVERHYGNGGDVFRIAVRDGEVVGTIALNILQGNIAALRKFYVAPEFRGMPWQLADRLWAEILDHSRDRNVSAIYLGVAEQFARARSYYLKNGFHPVGPEELPAAFPRTKVDRYFFRLFCGQ